MYFFLFLFISFYFSLFFFSCDKMYFYDLIFFGGDFWTNQTMLKLTYCNLHRHPWGHLVSCCLVAASIICGTARLKFSTWNFLDFFNDFC